MTTSITPNKTLLADETAAAALPTPSEDTLHNVADALYTAGVKSEHPECFYLPALTAKKIADNNPHNAARLLIIVRNALARCNNWTATRDGVTDHELAQALYEVDQIMGWQA